MDDFTKVNQVGKKQTTFFKSATNSDRWTGKPDFSAREEKTSINV